MLAAFSESGAVMHVHNLSVILISFKEQSLRNVLKTEENLTEAKKQKQVKEGRDVKYSEEMERNSTSHAGWY